MHGGKARTGAGPLRLRMVARFCLVQSNREPLPRSRWYMALVRHSDPRVAPELNMSWTPHVSQVLQPETPQRPDRRPSWCNVFYRLLFWQWRQMIPTSHRHRSTYSATPVGWARGGCEPGFGSYSAKPDISAFSGPTISGADPSERRHVALVAYAAARAVWLRRGDREIYLLRVAPRELGGRLTLRRRSRWTVMGRPRHELYCATTCDTEQWE